MKLICLNSVLVAIRVKVNTSKSFPAQTPTKPDHGQGSPVNHVCPHFYSVNEQIKPKLKKRLKMTENIFVKNVVTYTLSF